MADILRLVGKNVRRLRVEQHMTQESLAHEADVTTSFLSQIENGKRNPTVGLLAAIADALAVPIVELFLDSTVQPDRRPSRLQKKRKPTAGKAK